MEKAREIAVISWRELRDELTKYADFIDHLPLEQSVAAAVSLANLSHYTPSFIYSLCERQIHKGK